MTDFEKVKLIYNQKDEWDRFDTPGGKLEFELTMAIITSHLPKKAELLDLGGGPGRYTIELAKLGHSLHLAELTQRNLDTAKKKIAEYGIDNVKSIYWIFILSYIKQIFVGFCQRYFKFNLLRVFIWLQM